MIHYLKRLAELHSQNPIEYCAITVPDFFSESQHFLMKQVLMLAGCSEPVSITDSTAGNCSNQ